MMRTIRWPVLLLGVLTLAVAFQSYPLANAQSRLLYGYVYSAATGKPIDAIVTISQCFNQQTVLTSADGSWELSYPYGTVGSVTFSATGYASQTFPLYQTAQWYYSGGVILLQP